MATSAVLEEELAYVRDVANHYLETGFHIHGRYPKSTLASLPSMTKLVRQIAKAQKRPVIIVDTRYDGLHSMTVPATKDLKLVVSALLMVAERVERSYASQADVSVFVSKSVMTFWFRKKEVLANFIKNCQEDKACHFALKLPPKVT